MTPQQWRRILALLRRHDNGPMARFSRAWQQFARNMRTPP